MKSSLDKRSTAPHTHTDRDAYPLLASCIHALLASSNSSIATAWCKLAKMATHNYLQLSIGLLICTVLFCRVSAAVESQSDLY